VPRLLSEKVAERLVAAVSDSDSALNFDLLKTVIEAKEKVAHRAQSVLAFLFTTLAAIAIVLFDESWKEAAGKIEFLGMKLAPTDFVFVGFAIGNVLYVVHTGLFHKIFTFEYLLLKTIQSPRYKDNRELSAFLASDPINIFACYRLFRLMGETEGPARAIITVTDIYSKYIVLVAYGLFYFTVLGIALSRFWPRYTVYFWSLVAMNIFAILTSLAVFYPVRRRRAKVRHAVP
jgi:hypothetical protein